MVDGFSGTEGFSDAEFRRRWDAVSQAVGDSEFDVLIVTARAHLEYLTGHPCQGAYAAPYALTVGPDVPRILVVREYDEAAVRRDLRVPIDHVVTYFGLGDAMGQVARQVVALGFADGVIGIERDHWGIAPADVDRLHGGIPDSKFRDGSRLVTHQMERHSAEEVAAIRQAMKYTERAIEAFYTCIREGVSELEALDAVEGALQEVGSGTCTGTLLFGNRTALPHGELSRYRLQRGDVAFIETSGLSNSFAAALCRTAVLGSHPAAEELHVLAEVATQAAIDAMRPGVTGEEVDHAVRSVIEGAGRGATMRQRTGYAAGLNWLERGYSSLEPGASEPIESGMTFHMPRILFDESGEFGVGTSETVLVTEEGVEVLSAIPRDLIVISA